MYCSVEVTVENRDINCLYTLVSIYGGSVSPVSDAAVRWRLHNEPGVTYVINDLIGLIQNPTRLNQIQAVCAVYKITYHPPLPMVWSSAYLLGLIDSDGSVVINWVSLQIIVSVSQKDRYLLDLLVATYGGVVYSANAAHTAYKWQVHRKEDVLRIAALADIYGLTLS